MLERKNITSPELHKLFFEISAILLEKDVQQVVDEYEDHLIDLMQFWQERGYIEIYQHNQDRVFGRIKPSDLAVGSVPFYLGLYHARLVASQNDPLIVITFEPEDNQLEKPIIRFILTHDIMFGSLEDKHFPEKMRHIRKRIDEFIQAGNA